MLAVGFSKWPLLFWNSCMLCIFVENFYYENGFKIVKCIFQHWNARGIFILHSFNLFTLVYVYTLINDIYMYMHMYMYVCVHTHTYVKWWDPFADNPSVLWFSFLSCSIENLYMYVLQKCWPIFFVSCDIFIWLSRHDNISLIQMSWVVYPLAYIRKIKRELVLIFLQILHL